MPNQPSIDSPNYVFDTRLNRRHLLKMAAGASAAVPALKLSGNAFAQDDASPTPVLGGTATVIVAANPDSWDLTKSTWVTWQAVCFLYDTLLVFDDQETLMPNLATAWEVSEDGLTYTLTLREGVQFHDGTTFDSESVRVNIQRHLDKPDSGFYATYEPVDHMEIVDPQTIKIILKQVTPSFALTGFAGWGALQLSPASYADQGGDNYGNPPIGTGPFKFVSYEPGSNIQYERFDDYWNGAPYLDKVEVKVIPDTSVQLTELEAKTSDAAIIGAKDVATAQDEGISVISKIAPGVCNVSMNVSRGATAELAVRQAICQAIDRQAMLDALVYGYGELSWAGVTSNSIFYTEDVSTWTYDPDAAEATLEAAGWVKGDDGMRSRDGEKLSVHILSTDFTDWALYNQTFQDMLKQIGIDSSISSLEWNAFLDQWRENQGDWDVTFMSQGSLFASTSPIQCSWYPDAYWTVTQIDDATDPTLVEVATKLQALQDEFQVTLDIDRQKEIAKEAQQIFYDNALTLFLWHSASLTAVLPRVKNYNLTFEGRIIELTKAWIE